MTSDQLYSLLIAPLVFTLINTFSEQLKVLITSMMAYVFGSINFGYYYVTLEYHKEDNREINDTIIAIRSYINKHKMMSMNNFMVMRSCGSDVRSYICPSDYITVKDVEVKFDGIAKVIIRSKKPVIRDFIIECAKSLDQSEATMHKSAPLQYVFQQDSSEKTLTFTRYVFKTYKTFDTLFYSNKKKVIALLDALASKHIPKVNLLLHGPPGSGKTSMIKSIASYTKRDVFIVKLADIRNVSDLCQLLFGDIIKTSYPYSGTWMTKTSNRIYVFEDIDCESTIVHDRANNTPPPQEVIITKNEDGSDVTTVNRKLSLSDILNAFDGIIELNETIMVFTTNHPEKLDPALIRPGRITLSLLMENMAAEDMRSMIKKYYGQSISERYIRDNVINPSKLESLCHTCPTIKDLKRELEFIT
jgi:GTPase SAR1 family protein